MERRRPPHFRAAGSAGPREQTGSYTAPVRRLLCCADLNKLQVERQGGRTRLREGGRKRERERGRQRERE